MEFSFCAAVEELVGAMLSDVVQLVVDRTYIFLEKNDGQDDQHHGNDDDCPEGPVQEGNATCHAEDLHKILFDANVGQRRTELQIISVDNGVDSTGTMAWTSSEGQWLKGKKAKGKISFGLFAF